MKKARVLVGATLLMLAPIYLAVGYAQVLEGISKYDITSSLSPSRDSGNTVRKIPFLEEIDAALQTNEGIYGLLLIALSILFLVSGLLLILAKPGRHSISAYLICFSTAWLGIEIFGYCKNVQFLQHVILSTLVPAVLATIVFILGVKMLVQER